MSIRNVAVVGANGNLGGPMLQALVDAGTFRVSVLRRATSRSPLPPAAHSVLAVDAWTVASLTTILRGQDAVVVCFPLRDVEDHLRLAEAAAAAGVRRYIPADFGSADARSSYARQLVPLFEKKETVRHKLEALAAATPGFSFTSIVGGHFFDWGLAGGFLHVYLDDRTMDILDIEGTPRRTSLSTLARLGEATVRVLARGADDAETANRVIFVQSVCVTQTELQDALERATAAADKAAAVATPKPWTLRHIDVDKFILDKKTLADAGDAEAVEDLVYALGIVDGNWTRKDTFSVQLLGLEDQDLDVEVAKVVNAHAK